MADNLSLNNHLRIHPLLFHECPNDVVFEIKDRSGGEQVVGLGIVVHVTKVSIKVEISDSKGNSSYSHFRLCDFKGWGSSSLYINQMYVPIKKALDLCTTIRRYTYTYQEGKALELKEHNVGKLVEVDPTAFGIREDDKNDIIVPFNYLPNFKYEVNPHQYIYTEYIGY